MVRARLSSIAAFLCACGGAPVPSPAPPPSPPPVARQESPAPDPEPAPAFTPTDADRAAWAQAEQTLDFNAHSNFGGGALTSGFTPDPGSFPLTAGGGRNPVDVSSLHMRDSATGADCSQSFVTRRPDFHFEFATGTSFDLLRFYVVTQNNTDATLIINEPGAQWRCNDDHGRSDWDNGLMPAIDFHNPAPGRYDIWVGTYDRSSNNPATLYVTELDSNHP